MSKLKIRPLKSYREYLESTALTKGANADAIVVVDYSLAHPSSLAEKQEQAQRAIREREETERKNS